MRTASRLTCPETERPSVVPDNAETEGLAVLKRRIGEAGFKPGERAVVTSDSEGMPVRSPAAASAGDSWQARPVECTP